MPNEHTPSEHAPNGHAPKYGTGEFPPPRGFDCPVRAEHWAEQGASAHPLPGSRYVGPGFTTAGQRTGPGPTSADRHAGPVRETEGQDGSPGAAPVKIVVMLCAAALTALAIGLALWTLDCLSGLVDPASAIGSQSARAQSGSSGGTAIEGAAEAGPGTSAPESTPRSEWRAGQVPRLFQTDAEWGAAPYADGAISTHGCGPTCLAMVYVALTGRDDMDPEDMAEFSELNGFVDNGVTSWLLMSQGAALVGLESEEVPGSVEAVESHLMAGEPVICSVHEGDFTTEGHFIMLVGLNADGTVEIRDPNSEDRTDARWDLGRVVSQCNNIWAFSL